MPRFDPLMQRAMLLAAQRRAGGHVPDPLIPPRDPYTPYGGGRTPRLFGPRLPLMAAGGDVDPWTWPAPAPLPPERPPITPLPPGGLGPGGLRPPARATMLARRALLSA